MRTLLLFLSFSVSAFGQNWPQGPGPNFDFTAPGADIPQSWSVSLNQNIAWRVPLPETGQSTPVIWGDRIFVSTMKPAGGDAESGKDIVAYCLSSKDGRILWQRDIPGSYNTRLSGPFGDASSPAAVTDGKSVWFLNPTGRIACFDLDGNPRWDKATTSVVRTRPILFEGKLIFHRQVYLPNEAGKFGHENKNAGLEKWTQLQAIDASSGEPVWLSTCGVNMGCIPMIQRLADGTVVLVVGRGGGHGPPEKPSGVSMIRADNGKTLWSLELPGFMSTQTYPVVDDQALVFHKNEHLWVDATTGKVTRRVSIADKVAVRRHSAAGRSTVIETLAGKKARAITQQSNLRVGNHHYFRSYTANYLGRVDITTGAVSYLELPLQVLREPGKPEQVLWPKADAKKNAIGATIRPNSVRNSQGFQVMGDGRAVQNGWGHSASPIASACGNQLFVPMLCGLVFVIQADAPTLDESAILSISDLGPLGEAFTRASISTDGKRLYAHSIRELIAIGKTE